MNYESNYEVSKMNNLIHCGDLTTPPLDGLPLQETEVSSPVKTGKLNIPKSIPIKIKLAIKLQFKLLC
jgi:hypothetical protein